MSWQPLASPAPYLSEKIQVDACVVEPATVDPVQPADAPVAEPCLPVDMPIAEPAPAELDASDYSSYIPVVDATEVVDENSKVDDKNDEDFKYTSYETLCSMDGGADFESYAAVLPGNPGKNLLQKFQSIITTGKIERDFVAYGEVRRYVVIKYGYLFVFEDVTARSPLFAFPLQGCIALLEDPNAPSPYSYTISPSLERDNLSLKDLCTVLLYTQNDPKKVYFQITFVVKGGEKELVSKFMALFENSNKAVEGKK